MATATGEWQEITRGVVFPWHCDHYGHMNVRWYTHFFDDATFLVWSLLGVDMRDLHAAGPHTVIARSTIEYVREMLAGDLVLVTGAFSRVGTRSVTLALRMLDATSRELRARQETVIVFFDAESRQSVPIPATLRPVIEAALVDADGT